MDEKLFDLISQLISTGGNTAIWVVVLIYGTQIIKTALWLGGLIVLAKTIGGAIVRSTQIVKEVKDAA